MNNLAAESVKRNLKPMFEVSCGPVNLTWGGYEWRYHDWDVYSLGPIAMGCRFCRPKIGLFFGGS